MKLSVVLSVLTLERGVEDMIANSIQRTEQSSFLSLEPTVAEKVIVNLKEAAESIAANLETPPILLASPMIRMYIRKLTERFLPDLVVLSHNELIPTIQIKTLKVIGLNAN